MKTRQSTILNSLATLCLTIITMPALSHAQQGQAGRGGGGAGGGAVGQMPQLLQQVLGQLDLSPDQKTKIDGIIKQAQQDGREAMQGMQDATPEERQQKMQDLRKMMTDTKSKVEAELTPEQKAKYYPLVAKAGLKQMTDLITAVKTGSTKLEVPDDQKKQLKDLFEETDKSLDGFKSDAEGVKDEATATDFQQKMTKLQMDTRKQLVEILGQDDTTKLMQSARQSMRGTVRAGRPGASNQDAATTQPAAK